MNVIQMVCDLVNVGGEPSGGCGMSAMLIVLILVRIVVR